VAAKVFFDIVFVTVIYIKGMCLLLSKEVKYSILLVNSVDPEIGTCVGINKVSSRHTVLYGFPVYCQVMLQQGILTQQ
jgi:hypothetical protein